MLEPFIYTPPAPGDLPVVHVDQALLLIDKPSGLLSVPGKTPDMDDCVASRARAAFPRARMAHRLDLDTSGIMVLGRTFAAQRDVSMQFERRLIDKTYLAVVAGRVAEDSGEIDLPLASDWPNRPLQRVDMAVGKPSQTRWQVLERGANRTRLRLEPVTGRTHQLRVHLAAIGHPILGDRFYAPDPVRNLAPRLLLHAESLTLDHPTGGERLRYAVPAVF